MIRPLAAALLLLALGLGLNLPTSLPDLGRLATWAVPIEIVGALLLCAWAPASWRRPVALALAALLAWFVTFRIVDWLVWQTMGRPITLVFDLPLLGSLLEVARASLGLAGSIGVLVAALAPLLLVTWLAYFALATLARVRSARLASLAATLAVAGTVGFVGVTPGDRVAVPVVSAHGLSQARAQVRRAGAAVEAEARWQVRAAADQALIGDGAGVLGRLRRTDVWLLFIESYGRTVLEDPAFAARIGPALDAAGRALGAAGLGVASGWLRSPTVGGQSWLAHATLTSGVLTKDEASYAVYRERAHADLAHLFRRLGHHTVLLAPGMERPFPEATERLGFATIYGAPQLGYAGPRFEWVPMPDQFALEAARRQIASSLAGSRLPVFVQAALVGSHAPFTPRPTLVADWDRLGDGSVYARLPSHGGAPVAVWRDRAELRAAYGEAIALTLDTVSGFAARIMRPGTLLILVGDHEPASLVTAAPDARTVPMHVIAVEHDLLEPFLSWGFASGLRPDAGAPVHDMAAFRSFFVTAFGGSGRAP